MLLVSLNGPSPVEDLSIPEFLVQNANQCLSRQYDSVVNVCKNVDVYDGCPWWMGISAVNS